MSEENIKPEELKQTEKINVVSYVVIIGFKRVGIFDNFPEAFKKLDEQAEDIMDNTSYLIRISNGIELYLPNSKAQDLAYGVGLFQVTYQDFKEEVFTDMPQAANLEEIVRQEFINHTREIFIEKNNSYIEYLHSIIIDKAIKDGARITQLVELHQMMIRAKKNSEIEIQRIDCILAEF